MKHFGDYDILEELGRGATGLVYHARRRSDGLDVALKLLRKEADAAGLTGARLAEEASLASSLESPHIARVFEFGEKEGRPFVAMEYLAGGSLTRAIDDDALTQVQAVQIAVKISAALEHGHRKGVIHRDVKPANILMTGEKEPKLVDFGLAVKIDVSRVSAVEALGTPAYMSPEQAGKGRVDHRTDIYSLGAVLYEMLTGRPPFTAETAMAVMDMAARREPPLPSEINPSIPEKLENILLRAMRKDPEKRYQTAADFGADLRRFLAGKEPAAQGEERWIRLYSELRRRTWAVALSFVLAFALPFATVMLLRLSAAKNPENDRLHARESWSRTAGLLAESGLLPESYRAHRRASEDGTGTEAERAAAELGFYEVRSALEEGDIEGARTALEEIKGFAITSAEKETAELEKAVKRESGFQAAVREALIMGAEFEEKGAVRQAFDVYREARSGGSTPELEEALLRAWAALRGAEAESRFREALAKAEGSKKVGDWRGCLSAAHRALAVREDEKARALLEWAEDRSRQERLEEMLARAKRAEADGELERAEEIFREAGEIALSEDEKRRVKEGLDRIEGVRRGEARDRFRAAWDAAMEKKKEAEDSGDPEAWDRAAEAFRNAAELSPEPGPGRDEAEACSKEARFVRARNEGERARAEKDLFAAREAFELACREKPDDKASATALDKIVASFPSPPRALEGAFAYPTRGKDRLDGPVVQREGKLKQSRTNLPFEIWEKESGMAFVLLPEGEYVMGSPKWEKGRRNTEGPFHPVRLGRPLYLGKYEITQDLWERWMKGNPSRNKGDWLPVEGISWKQAAEFTKKMNEGLLLKAGVRGARFRLPAEAEWEYAARAGAKSAFPGGDDPKVLAETARYEANSEGRTWTAGSLAPNPWGFYDLHGNVSEWCGDLWHDSYAWAPEDGSSWIKGGKEGVRVIRGGNCLSRAAECRSASRASAKETESTGTTGLRLVLEWD